MIVCKFGGSSVANEHSAKKIKNILNQNDNRKIVVVSALGKSIQHSFKITDKLFELYYLIIAKEKYLSIIEQIFDRYSNLSKLLNVNINWSIYKEELLTNIKSGNYTKEYLVSRGEYYSAMLYAKYLGIKFLDAKDYIMFNKNGTLNFRKTKTKLKQLNLKDKYVIGGYYGSNSNGEICVFDRGGSDITGAIICKALNFDIYENFTDVDGVFDKNPNIFSNSISLPILSVNTAIKMAECGNEVVHKDALSIIKSTNAMLVVKSTNNFQKLGTVVTYGLNNGFNSKYVCVCDLKLLAHDKQTPFAKNKLQRVEVLKVLCDSLTRYFLAKNIFVGKQNAKIKEKAVDVKLISIFSEQKILDKKTLQKLNKLKKKIKKYIIFCKFCSYFNNFNIICTVDNYSNVLKTINTFF